MNRFLTASCYAVLGFLIVSPLAETAVSVLPFRPGEVNWRFGVAGLFSRALMTPLLGYAGICALAVVLGHRRTLRTLSVIAGIIGVVLLGASIFFILDSIQARAQVPDNAKTAFDIAAALALSKIGIVGLIAVLLSIGGWKASRRPSRRTAPVAGLVGVTQAAGTTQSR